MATPKGTKPWNYGTSKGWVDTKGYRCRYVTEDGKRRPRREQRIVMEEHLGRKLEPWELVHHKDGNKLNNDISNLEIQKWSEHTTEHNLGATRSEQTCRKIGVYARMRQALKEERQAKAQMVEALAGLIPQNLSLENLQWPDEMTVPIDVSLGELRRAREALKAAGVDL